MSPTHPHQYSVCSHVGGGERVKDRPALSKGPGEKQGKKVEGPLPSLLCQADTSSFPCYQVDVNIPISQMKTQTGLCSSYLMLCNRSPRHLAASNEVSDCGSGFPEVYLGVSHEPQSDLDFAAVL